MNNEEVGRKIAFIIDQKAQFTVDMQRLRESQAQSEQIVIRLAEVTDLPILALKRFSILSCGSSQ